MVSNELFIVVIFRPGFLSLTSAYTTRKRTRPPGTRRIRGKGLQGTSGRGVVDGRKRNLMNAYKYVISDSLGVRGTRFVFSRPKTYEKLFFSRFRVRGGVEKKNRTARTITKHAFKIIVFGVLGDGPCHGILSLQTRSLDAFSRREIHWRVKLQLA